MVHPNTILCGIVKNKELFQVKWFQQNLYNE